MYLKEDFCEIEGFKKYMISNHGYVMNIKSGRPRKATRNQQGIGIVTMFSEQGGFYTKSVSRLVADSFLPNPYDPAVFNSVINLDGDRTNADVRNLMWRPRWFAIQYHRQFEYDDFNIEHIPFRDRETGEEFPNFVAACTKFGLYFVDIIKSCDFEQPTFPTGQQFEWVR